MSRIRASCVLCDGPTDAHEGEGDHPTLMVWDHIKREHFQTRGVAEASYEQLSRTATPGAWVRSLADGDDALIVIYEEAIPRGHRGEAI